MTSGKFCLFFVFFLQAFCAQSQKNNYSVLFINKDLLKNANAVKRFEEMRLVIDDIGKATLYHKYAITILNEGGDKYAEFSEYYDKLRTIKHVDGQLFDAFGSNIRSMKKGDLQDVSLSGEVNFVDDNRIKYHNFHDKVYPYTVEYETEINFKGIFYLPNWMPVDGSQMSVGNSKLIVETPQGYKLRYKGFNIDSSVTVTNKKDGVIYNWQVENIPAMSKQVLSQEWYELTPTVFLAPTDFSVEDYKGSMSTWTEMGKFIYNLNAGRNQLPPTIKNTIHQLADSISDEHEKIKALYKYFQKNTRYVSIQLGIGGWQTFPAEYVAQKGYGDCKALSNYMCSILNEAGLPSRYTLIKAGDNNKKILVDFPSTQFNHIIVCVPLKKDTVWLECTSQTLPVGYLSSFTSNRYALLVDEKGGEIVRTPKYTINDNLQTRNINAIINEDGDLSLKMTTAYSAMQQDELHSVINGMSKEKIDEYLKDEIKLPSFDIVNYAYKEEVKRLPVIYEDLEIKAKNYAQVSGKRLFVAPNVLTRTKMRLPADSVRKDPINMDFEFSDIDTVHINFPVGYEVESIPKAIKIENKFGKYMMSAIVKDNQIIYYRTREQSGGIFPAVDYIELAKFYNDIYKADNSLIVLKKNEK